MDFIGMITAWRKIHVSPKKTENKRIDIESKYHQGILQRVKEAENINEILEKNNINTIGILGRGYAGKQILKKFLNSSCEVLFYDDPNITKEECYGVPVMDYAKHDLPNVDIVIICEYYYDWVKFQMINSVYKNTVLVSIDEFLNDNINAPKAGTAASNNYFFGAGFAKCATTTMDAILRQHPEIEMACHKEPVFWTEDILYDKGVDWYINRYYPKKNSGKLRGEFNPWNQGHERNIQDYMGNETKFLYIIRNPIDAVISRFKHFYINGQYDIKDDPGKLTSEVFESFVNTLKTSEQARLLIADYMYGKHFSNVLKYVDKERIMLIDFNEFIKDTEGTSKKVFEFLGVNPEVKIDYNIKTNVGARLPKSMKAMQKAKKQFRFWWEVYIPFFPYLGWFERTMDKWRWSISDRASVKCDVKLDVSDDMREFLKEKYRDDVRKFDELFDSDFYTKWKL